MCILHRLPNVETDPATQSEYALHHHQSQIPTQPSRVPSLPVPFSPQPMAYKLDPCLLSILWISSTHYCQIVCWHLPHIFLFNTSFWWLKSCSLAVKSTKKMSVFICLGCSTICSVCSKIYHSSAGITGAMLRLRNCATGITSACMSYRMTPRIDEIKSHHITFSSELLYN